MPESATQPSHFQKYAIEQPGGKEVPSQVSQFVALSERNQLPFAAVEAKAPAQTPEKEQKQNVDVKFISASAADAIYEAAKKDKTGFKVHVDLVPMHKDTSIQKAVMHVTGERGEKVEVYFTQLNKPDGRDVYRVVDSDGKVLDSFISEGGTGNYNHVTVDFKESGELKIEGPFPRPSKPSPGSEANGQNSVSVPVQIKVQHFGVKSQS